MGAFQADLFMLITLYRYVRSIAQYFFLLCIEATVSDPVEATSVSLILSYGATGKPEENMENILFVGTYPSPLILIDLFVASTKQTEAGFVLSSISVHHSHAHSNPRKNSIL